MVECRLVIDIPFYVSGHAEKHIRYDIDSLALVKSLQDLQLINNDINTTIKSVEFYSSVSPEGSYKFNKKLGKKRIKTVERIVRRYLQIPENVPVTYTERLIPWNDFLLPTIEADTTLTHREDLLRIINNTPRKTRRSTLMRARDGKLWKVVKREYFKHMRKGGAIIIVERVTYEDMVTENSPKITFSNGVPTVEVSELNFPGHEEDAKRDSLASQYDKNKFNHGLLVKTNALGWGLAISNIAIEADIAKHWSISIPVYYSAWNYSKPTVKFRTFLIQPEVRYWLKENNTGFFVGAHFGLAYYNVAVDGLTRYQDHNGKSPALGGGISIGYRLPLSKKHENWKIEFTIGAGAYSLYYDTFYNVENGRLYGSHRKTYWGIDNAAINISYRFNLDKRKK